MRNSPVADDRLSRTRLTRRSFLHGALAAGIAGGGLSPLAARAVAAASASTAAPGLPPLREIWRWQQGMVALGPRFSGSAAHAAFVDFLDHQLSRLGLRVHRDRQRFDRWLARSWSLELLEGRRTRSVPVASYYSYSGSTPAHGVTSELVYLGAVAPPSLPGNPLNLAATSAALRAAKDAVSAHLARRLAAVPGGVAGKIVLMDALIPALPFGALYADTSYLYDPAGTLGPNSDYKRAWTLLATLPPLDAFRSAGAAGVVFALDAAPANAAGQYAPFIEPLQNLPALLVDRDAGAVLRDAVGTRVRLTLRADLTPNVPTDTLWTVIPGASDELLIVNTHTDGPNAVEENGGLGLLALAHHLTALPRAARHRSIALVLVTGHFANALKSTNGWVADHPDLVRRAAAGVCLEHLGVTEWTDDPVHGYRPTGLTEPALAFHSQTPLLATAVDAVNATDLQRTVLLRPAGVTFVGEGAALHESGIPTLGYVPGPNYLLSWADDGHLGKLDPHRMYREVGFAADLLHRLARVPAAVLKAGDSAALPPQLGGYLPVK